jgi:hypothetical protein
MDSFQDRETRLNVLFLGATRRQHTEVATVVQNIKRNIRSW